MIGIMSDSHDNREALKAAVRLFNDMHCELVIHAGDFVAPFAASELQNLSCSVKAVFGNCDGEKQGLKRTIDSFGKIQDPPFGFVYEEQNFLLLHTHFSVNSYAKNRNHDIIIFGHTHKPKVRRQEKTLIINPGETGGWVSGKSTVAVLDPSTFEVEIIPL
jgi:hypothetical protein